MLRRQDDIKLYQGVVASLILHRRTSCRSVIEDGCRQSPLLEDQGRVDGGLLRGQGADG